MNVFTIMMNLRTIFSVIADIESVVESLVKGPDKIPSAEQIKLVIDSVRKLLDAGIIQVPGMDDAKVSEELLKIEGLISETAIRALQNLIKYGSVSHGPAEIAAPKTGT